MGEGGEGNKLGMSLREMALKHRRPHEDTATSSREQIAVTGQAFVPLAGEGVVLRISASSKASYLKSTRSVPRAPT